MKQAISICIIFVLILLSSCKDDEVPPAIISFSTESTIVNEGIGNASILVILDKAAPGDITINFTIVGSAQATTDYETSGSATILSGETEGEILISIVDDSIFEYEPELAELTDVLGESIEISLASINGNGKFSEDAESLKHLLIIRDNEPVDRSVTITLSWDSGDGTPGDVDMDLFLFYIDPVNGPMILAAATTIGNAFEGIVIGTPAPDGMYGLAFRYFEGTSDNLTFTSEFVAENAILPGGGPVASFTGIYTLDNVNGDVTENASVEIVQTFEKQGLNYTTISDISIPDSGSRSRGFRGKAPAKINGIGNTVN